MMLVRAAPLVFAALFAVIGTNLMGPFVFGEWLPSALPWFAAAGGWLVVARSPTVHARAFLAAAAVAAAALRVVALLGLNNDLTGRRAAAGAAVYAFAGLGTLALCAWFPNRQRA